MKPAEKIAVAYGVSVLGAAAISYWRGRELSEILVDAMLHGAVAGTALTVVGWLMTESGEEVPVLAMANEALTNGSEMLNNPDVEGMGKLAKQGLSLLSRVNSDDLFRAMKENGVKFGVVPENPSIINQDAD